MRRAGKIHFDEIDCKTVWTPESVTWKRHIDQPKTVSATIDLLKKDAAYQLASGTAQWWMDLTQQGWFDAPEAVEPLRRLAAIDERLRASSYAAAECAFGEVALVVSQRSMMFQAPREGLANATLKMFRNWHLSRLGAPFEQILVDDLGRADLPKYKLYIMANLFYASAADCQAIERVVKRAGSTVLWIYAPGYLDDVSASLENSRTLTGIQLGRADVTGDLDVEVTSFAHPLTSGLPAGFAYGTSIDYEQYARPPKMQYLPNLSVNGAYYADDPTATTLGMLAGVGRPGLVVKELPVSGGGTWRSVYSAAPLLTWPLLRNLARLAGVHLFADEGDMVWANSEFLAFYPLATGRRTLRFPRPVAVEDAYSGERLGEGIMSLDLVARRYEPRLLFYR